MDIGYSLWDTGLRWFENAPGGVNRWSVGAFLVLAAGAFLMTRGMVGGGLTGKPGQGFRFLVGVLSFLAALGGFFTFLFILMGAYDLPPFGKEALACLAAGALGLGGIVWALKGESRAGSGQPGGEGQDH